jgi:hypothetical protein
MVQLVQLVQLVIGIRTVLVNSPQLVLYMRLVTWLHMKVLRTLQPLELQVRLVLLVLVGQCWLARVTLVQQVFRV